MKSKVYPKREAVFTGEFKRAVRDAAGHDIWFAKIHGHEMQSRGLPDIIGCYTGIFWGIEFKVMRSGKYVVTPYQKYVKESIEKAGGFWFVVWFDEKTADVGINEMRYDNKKSAVQALLSWFKPKTDL